MDCISDLTNIYQNNIVQYINLLSVISNEQEPEESSALCVRMLIKRQTLCLYLISTFTSVISIHQAVVYSLESNQLSAPLRSNGADYVLLRFILFFYSTFVLRNYPTDSHKIFRNCVFWCSFNNPILLKNF